jgi:hypothetical protein
MMKQNTTTWLFGCALILALGACDEPNELAEEHMLAEQADDEREIADAIEAEAEDEHAPRETLDPSLDELSDAVDPAANDCSKSYWENSHAYQACGTCENGRLNSIIHRQCWGTGFCPKECGPWTPYYTPCVPC